MEMGFSRVRITPPLGTSLCGQVFEYRAKGVESELYATAMVLDDGSAQAAMVSCDVILLTTDTAREVREAAAQRTGIPAEHIIVSATHTHSGPSTMAILGAASDHGYIESMKDGIVEAIAAARGQARPGRLEVAQGTLAGYAFNRRFLMSDGTVATHPFKLDPHIVEQEGPDSEALTVFCATDDAGKAMGAAVHFACHATVMERNNELVSADFPGKAAEFVRQGLGEGVECLFLQGASGNICQVNPRDGSRKEVGLAWTKEMGAAIGEKALGLMREGAVEARGRLRAATRTIEIARREIPPELLAWAQRHEPVDTELPTLSDYGSEHYAQDKGAVVSVEEIFRTPHWANFYASEIKILESLRREQPMLPLTLTVLAQDNWALAAIPAEVFIEHAQTIGKRSPFAMTAVVTLANGWNGYIPTKRAFARAGGYETKEVTTTMLVPDAGEMVTAAVAQLLAEVSG